MRWAVLIAYCLLIGLADAAIMFLRPTPPSLDVVATHALPANWRIEPGDLRLAGATAHYTTRPVGADRPMDSATVATTPELVAEPGAVLVALPAAEPAGALNAGSALALCQGAKPLLDRILVRAKICAPGGACQVLVSLPADKAGVLAAFKTAPAPVLRPADKGCAA